MYRDMNDEYQAYLAKRRKEKWLIEIPLCILLAVISVIVFIF
jgi:hypothetical protein